MYQGLSATIWPVRAGGMLCAFSAAYHFLCLSLEFDGLLNRKHTLGALSFHRSTARPKPPTPSASSKATRVKALRGPDSDLPQRAVVGDISSTARSPDVVVLGNEELGLPGIPRAPLLPTDRGQVEGGHSWHAHKS
jgi:hypothetical protein